MTGIIMKSSVLRLAVLVMISFPLLASGAHSGESAEINCRITMPDSGNRIQVAVDGTIMENVSFRIPPFASPETVKAEVNEEDVSHVFSREDYVIELRENSDFYIEYEVHASQTDRLSFFSYKDNAPFLSEVFFSAEGASLIPLPVEQDFKCVYRVSIEKKGSWSNLIEIDSDETVFEGGSEILSNYFFILYNSDSMRKEEKHLDGSGVRAMLIWNAESDAEENTSNEFFTWANLISGFVCGLSDSSGVNSFSESYVILVLDKHGESDYISFKEGESVIVTAGRGVLSPHTMTLYSEASFGSLFDNALNASPQSEKKDIWIKTGFVYYMGLTSAWRAGALGSGILWNMLGNLYDEYISYLQTGFEAPSQAAERFCSDEQSTGFFESSSLMLFFLIENELNMRTNSKKSMADFCEALLGLPDEEMLINEKTVVGVLERLSENDWQGLINRFWNGERVISLEDFRRSNLFRSIDDSGIEKFAQAVPEEGSKYGVLLLAFGVIAVLALPFLLEPYALLPRKRE